MRPAFLFLPAKKSTPLSRSQTLTRSGIIIRPLAVLLLGENRSLPRQRKSPSAYNRPRSLRCTSAEVPNNQQQAQWFPHNRDIVLKRLLANPFEPQCSPSAVSKRSFISDPVSLIFSLFSFSQPTQPSLPLFVLQAHSRPIHPMLFETSTAHSHTLWPHRKPFLLFQTYPHRLPD